MCNWKYIICAVGKISIVQLERYHLCNWKDIICAIGKISFVQLEIYQLCIHIMCNVMK